MPQTNRCRDVVLSREGWRVLELLAVGMNTDEVAERLALSPDTVRRHFAEAVMMLEASSKLGAIIKAAELGLIDLTRRCVDLSR
jgi:DNA-binding NarL/FixJ family response regulator